VKFFVTGTAGFIGFHVAARLLGAGHEVAGYDGMTSYYDVALKKARLAMLRQHDAFQFTEAMLEDREALSAAYRNSQAQVVIHLAAQAGVRYALEAPEAYTQSNIVGTFNLLELLRDKPPEHFLFASTSSVYGGNTTMPFAETDRTDFPVSLYAATKKAGEAMCHTYAHLFHIPTTAFRFFTVYGPWGRPDMALFKFVRAIDSGQPIEVYGGGKMRRDFTYIDDLVDAIIALIDTAPGRQHIGQHDSLSPVAPFRTINIAGGNPVGLMDFIGAIESVVGRRAEKVLLGMQPGDVVETHADPALLKELVSQTPKTSIYDGVSRFTEWYREYSRSSQSSVVGR
jgi:UDP-glucuronate 4-epimerase